VAPHGKTSQAYVILSAQDPEMSSQMETVYLGLGSNLGDRKAFLALAISSLPPEVLLTRCSHIYETQPWGFQEQAEFLNLVLEAKTELSPAALLLYLKDIEKQVGRKARFLNGPREIDIDILFYGDQVIADESLIIPHPEIQKRSFVLGPLSEIAPDLTHPGMNKTVTELKELLDMSDIRQLSDKEICTENANNR